MVVHDGLGANSGSRVGRSLNYISQDFSCQLAVGQNRSGKALTSCSGTVGTKLAHDHGIEGSNLAVNRKWQTKKLCSTAVGQLV